MSLRWQEIVVIPEHEEPVACECCGEEAWRVEGRLVHREVPVGRFTVRWRPGVPEHPARHVLYLGEWGARRGDDPPRVAAADYWGGAAHGFYLVDDPGPLLRALAPWRPRFLRRADLVGTAAGQRVFAMLDAIHVKDGRLRELRDWAPVAEE
ncbi:hypothetical protein [Rubellimicrobium sp. CFH 75288]|uniref:hypothetical protein n=1 Tax=Rubellimicrobium sp. CFH 75288 TaxID=2697034 RepID=UPI00141274AD|nr:hypothetical protein [Rubellimicrobium sp. CFH 75288]NAZ35463.1 hypothetical protein [Rubellimicrobium sp. CFH 75288]